MAIALLTTADDLKSDVLVEPRPRLDTIDLLRGAVMALMVLDHTRDFFPTGTAQPEDLANTTAALFFTRWVTHFCAPTFMFLAGTGAFLARMRGKSKAELAGFLFTRGLFLIVLEWTVTRSALAFTAGIDSLPCVVLWALGWSMVALSALVFLPTFAIAGFALAMICAHNAFDPVRPQELGNVGGAIWKILHEARTEVELTAGVRMLILYPLVPWVGVMAAGYAFGEVFRWKLARRRPVVLALGLVVCSLFVILRVTNLYGDPGAWSTQRSPMITLLSFLNCAKYPPSLQFLLMTLGPVLVALAVFDGWKVAPPARPLIVLGRVPLFYYLLQWPVLILLSIVVAVVERKLVGHPGGSVSGPGGTTFHSLPFVYVMWLVALLILYPACAWFAALKKRRRDVWLSYL